MLPGGDVSHSTHASSHEMNSSIHQNDDGINSINNIEDVLSKSEKQVEGR